MATPSYSLAVKPLNKSPSGRRFVFKSFSQRIEEIEIDVYRSLDPVKAEPLGGSSFFLDCLVQWRELCTAEDFISFYEEMLPLVQTLPQIILQKEVILLKLLSRLHMKGRHSLEPILRLIAALSRDLLEDFLLFLPRIANSFESLLMSGAEREPEMIEQIFTSWSCIMMYLQKYLVRDVVNVLKVTANLRYYPKGYVQEFMAESVSFILRNAPLEQLIKGIRKVIFEVAKKPLPTRKSGVSALLWYAMRGTSAGLHSKATQVLPLLADNSLFAIGDKVMKGADTILEVLVMAFQRLCEDLEAVDLRFTWDCLHKEIADSIAKCDKLHLSRLLSLLLSTLQNNYLHKIPDYQKMLLIFELLRQNFLIPTNTGETVDQSAELIDKILQLMLCILDGLHSSNDIPALSSVSVQWAAVFSLQNTSLLTFIKNLLLKDPSILHMFRTNIICALNELVEISEEEVIRLLLIFCEKLQVPSSSFLDGISYEKLAKIHTLFQEELKIFIEMINETVRGGSSSIQFAESRFARLWGILQCYPYILDGQANPTLLLELVYALDDLLIIESGSLKSYAESLIANALASYYQVISMTSSGLQESAVCKSLYFAKRFSSSPQILSTVADNLDSFYGSMVEDGTGCIKYHPELVASKLVDALDLFAENLWHCNKEIRLSTLRLLCHYEPLNHVDSTRKQHDEKKKEAYISQTRHVDDQDANVLRLLRSIEATPLSVATFRKIILLISQIQMRISASSIAEKYIPIVSHGIIGILHNRFSYLWNPALDCLAALMCQYSGLLCEKYIRYLDHCVSTFLVSHDQSGRGETESSSDMNKASDLVESFRSFVAPVPDSTPSLTVLSLLIRALQKVPSIAESWSRLLVPLFLKFLGYDADNLVSVESCNSRNCKGNEWNGVLKEWLSLFTLMRNPKSFYQSQFFKEVLLYRLLDNNDAELQTRALDCLLNWKDASLHPYDQHLKNLINAETFRDELTTWSLSRESNHIDVHHRSYLVPVIIQLLIPNVRKLKTLASRKYTSVTHRKAVLGFLAQLDVDELPLFFCLLMKSLHSQEVDGTIECLPLSTEDEKKGLGSFSILKHFSARSVKALSWKKRCSFLHVVEEILAVFDDIRISPFLDFLMGCVVRILESCTSILDGRKSSGSCESGHLMEEDNQIMDGFSVKQLKDLRSLCLKVISVALTKYDDHDFGREFLDMFFMSVNSLIAGFKQEGASSVKPSSLFSCFLAMSRSYKLVALLFRENNLIPDIISLLTVMTASEGIVSCVFKFIKNLLNLNNELGDEDATIKRVLLPHLDLLLCSMHFLFTHNNAAKRKMMKSPGVQDLLSIFRLLPGYIKEPSAAEKFVEILLPVLRKKPTDSDSVVETLQIIGHAVPVLENECCRKIIYSVSPLLIYAASDIRASICELLDALSKKDSSMLSVAELLHELKATSSVEMGGLDYDTIIGAYERISIEFFYTVREEHAIIILSHGVHDMLSNDLNLRPCAFRVLCCFVEFSARLLRGEVNHDQGFLNGVCIQHLISKFLLKHMGNAMDKEVPVQKVWIDLLREMVLKLPSVMNLKSCQALCSEDPEQDFFNNILHLQKHRRSRALGRFTEIVNCWNLSEVVTNTVFVPLFFNMLFKIQNGEGEHIRIECMKALGSISGCMNWKAYYALLRRCFREMTLKPDKRKILLRLICFVLDHFHFSENHSEHEIVQSARESLDSDTIRLTSSPGLDNDELCNIQTCLQKDLLPKIQKMLSSDSAKVDVNVCLVALKLLKLLPGDMLRFHLQSIVHRISNFLKNRLESVRDEARSALAACLKELRLEDLQPVVQVLRRTLKRGFELHVLGFTLNYLLSQVLLNPFVGKLDYCLEDLLSIAVNDILGDVSEEKEVKMIASKMKETRKQKSYETLKLIAQSITFETHSFKLLSHVTVHLQKQLSPKVESKLENMLKHIAAGIKCNPSVNESEVFKFTKGLIESPDRLINVDPRYSHHITVFALGLLQNYTKSMKLKRAREMISELDPFISLLGECLNSKYEDIISAALRCLSVLARLQLPSFGSMGEVLKKALLVTVQSSVKGRSPLMDSCISLLTVLLQSTQVTLSTDQLGMLIQFPLFVDLGRNPSLIALSLLKEIVNKKLVVPEIYDVVQRVADIMVKSQVEPIRIKCSQILLRFLLDYHLSRKRLQEHLDFLLAHLKDGYEHATGKEAVLQMLHVIIMKFPTSILDEQSKTMFLHLVHRLANDSDNKIRSMLGAVIKLLISRVGPRSFQSMFEDSCSWYLSRRHQLCSAGAQALGLLVEAKKTDFGSRRNEILSAIRRTIQSASGVLADSQLDCSSAAMVPFWKEAYYSLTLLEKVLHQFPEWSLKTDIEDIWEAVCKLLLHPHLWLRNISNRLLCLYFASVTEAWRENNEALLGRFFLMTPSRLFVVAVSLCCQLKVSQINDAAGILITQNLVFCICGVHSFLSQIQCENPRKFWSSIQPDEQGRFLKAFHLLDSRKARTISASLTSDAGDAQDSDCCRYMIVSYLLDKLGEISLQKEATQMMIVFNCFKSVSPKLLEHISSVGESDFRNYVYLMLLPLYKVCEGHAGKIVSEDVKLLAEDTRECIKRIVGVESYVRVNIRIIKKLKARREKRKREVDLMAVVNPTRNAKRKIRIAAKNRANKKRRVMTSMKMGRWIR